MRIVYVLTSLGMGGAERQVIGLAERMAARGHEVSLLVIKPKVADEWPTTIECTYLNVRKNPLSVLRGLVLAIQFLNKFRPDILHSHTFPGNIFARILQFIASTTVMISTIHNVYEGGWLRMVAYRLTDFLSHKTTAVSEAAAERYIRLKAVSSAKCIVLPNGIEVEQFHACEEKTNDLRVQLDAADGFVWLAAGRVVPAKDYENLLKAFSQLRLQHPNTWLWIAGSDDTDEAMRLRVVADELGVSRAVRWLGLRRDLPQLMQAADGFVLSSAWEGMPLALGEAMAAAKPVVATDVGGVRELVGQAGIVVRAKDHAALAAAMHEVQAESDEVRRARGSAARERIQTQFSMDQRATEWEEVYRVEVVTARVHRNRIQIRQLWELILVAAVVRLLLLVCTLLRTGTSVIASGDTASYLEPGRRLLVLGEFATAAGSEIDRTPGYPIFLALASLPGSIYAVLAQVLLSVMSVYLVAQIASRVFAHHKNGREIAILAAWLFAIEPMSIIYSIRLLPETLFVFLLLLCIERMVAFIESHHLRTLAWSGVWLVVATYVRPVSYYLPILFAIGLFFVLARKLRLRWQAPLVLFVVTVPLLCAWQIRNFHETRFSGFSSIAQKNLYFYQAAEVTARVNHQPIQEVQSELGYASEESYRKIHPEQVLWTAGQRAAYQQQQAVRVLREHPWVYLESHLMGSAVVTFTPCAAELFRLLGEYPDDAPKRVVNEGAIKSLLRITASHPVIASVMALLELFLIGLYALAILAILHGTIRQSIIVFLLGVALYFIVVSGGAQAVGRYRLPVMPIVCVFAACGLQKQINRRLSVDQVESVVRE